MNDNNQEWWTKHKDSVLGIDRFSKPTHITNDTFNSSLYSPDNSGENKSIKWFVPILAAIVIFIATISALVFIIYRKYFPNTGPKNTRNWATLNEINEESFAYNYGTCDEDTKSSVYSYIESIDSNPQTTRCFRVTNSITWPTVNLFNRMRNMSLREKLRLHLASKSTRKFQTDDEIMLKSRQHSPTSSSIDSITASYNSLNSITTILSNDNLNLFNLNQTKLMKNNRSASGASALLTYQADTYHPNIVLNYSIYFNNLKKSLIINIISLESVQMPPGSLITNNNNLELNIYVKVEILPPKEVTMMSINSSNGVSTSSSASSSSLLPAKITAKTRVIRNKSNPIYNETFEFDNLSFVFDRLVEDDGNEINLYKCYRLVFNVCNSNLFGRDQIIGQTVHNLVREDCFIVNEYKKIMQRSASSKSVASGVVTDLKDNECIFSRIYSRKVDLVADTRLNDVNLGQIHMSLVYQSSTQTIKMHILKGTSLKLPKHFLNADKIPNSFVKVYMLFRGQRVDKKQTKVVQESRDPVYDETFEFNLLNLLQLTQPMDNIAFEDLNETYLFKKSDESAAATTSHHQTSGSLNPKVASRLQFVLLVMDWDQMEKNDVIGKIELNTQHHQKRLLSFQLQQNYNFKKETVLESAVGQYGASSSVTDDKLFKNNWFDIFYKPNFPILCTFQINSY